MFSCFLLKLAVGFRQGTLIMYDQVDFCSRFWEEGLGEHMEHHPSISFENAVSKDTRWAQKPVISMVISPFIGVK